MLIATKSGSYEKLVFTQQVSQNYYFEFDIPKK